MTCKQPHWTDWKQSFARQRNKTDIGLVLPVTASDMRAEPFGQIVQELTEADYIDTIVVALGVAPDQV